MFGRQRAVIGWRLAFLHPRRHRLLARSDAEIAGASRKDMPVDEEMPGRRLQDVADNSGVKLVLGGNGLDVVFGKVEIAGAAFQKIAPFLALAAKAESNV